MLKCSALGCSHGNSLLFIATFKSKSWMLSQVKLIRCVMFFTVFSGLWTLSSPSLYKTLSRQASNANNHQVKLLLPQLRTHLLVSSSCWIFLCNSRLWAPHADILQKEEEENEGRIVLKKISFYDVASPALHFSLCQYQPADCYRKPHSVIQGLHPLSSSGVSLVWFNHCESIMPSTDNDTLLIRSAWIWFNYQRMLTLGETISLCHETFVIGRQQSSSLIEMLIACN